VNRLAPRQVDTGPVRGHPMLFGAGATEDTTRRWPSIPPGPYVGRDSKSTFRILRRPSASSEVSLTPSVQSADATLAIATSYPATEAILIQAAETGGKGALVQVASATDWSRQPPTALVLAVSLALSAGAHFLARDLATQGAELNPNHQELRKLAHVLAPPRVTRADASATGSLRANQAWLRENAGEYQGQWVALHEGTLLAAGPSARGVWESLESTEDVMLTKVV
jgi:hypothetical protein